MIAAVDDSLCECEMGFMIDGCFMFYFFQSTHATTHCQHVAKNIDNTGSGRAPAFISSSCGRPKQQQAACSHRLQSTTSDNIVDHQVWTFDDIQDFARKEGVELSKTNLGPAFRTVARSTHNSSKILGYGEGFVRPAGKILHLDKMEVFKPIVKQVRKENPDFRGGGTIFGVGLLFGYQCLLHGIENGCTEAEFLAIDDEDFQHKRLVRFYKNSGFKIIKYVGEDFQSIPDRMVWGGCGTLMRGNIKDDLLPLWSSLFIKATEREKNKINKV
ncbi:hypothetical protein FRACYDRAFT_249870 [Fragilariopsis cylindrus CCMP1102]|uniref:Uncharacterized protein n=1 Tax=Fragilariopsis cylindrus CCMP1102 TaxID=635003 RepID=A0A1E7ERB2_9STRA|nr:hypothetical protein FRACYDRAFT_249870 [Fragilariopsis cylindrus CCMP1102]|eukprot:OEU08482.1 hypothetical protein FRACYDRAFT_249870 [Fragilariopsis cylindrus CCMP1102]